MQFRKSALRWVGQWYLYVCRKLSPLSDLRITILLLCLTGYVVVELSQGRDVVRGLVDDGNKALHVSGPNAFNPLIQWFAFWFACLWSGVNSWYWANLLYKVKCGAHQPLWFRWFRRILGIAPLTVAIVAMRYASGTWIDIWLATVCFALTDVLLLGFFLWRTSKLNGAIGARAYFGRKTAGLPLGDLWFMAFTACLALALLIILLIPSVRTHAAWTLGSAALAFGSIGCMIPITSFIIYMTRSYRIPAIGVLISLAVLFSFWNDNHAVRTLSSDVKVKRPTLQAALAQWEQLHPSQLDPIVLVAASGGASRAAYWTGTVLRALDKQLPFSQNVFAISSVSGGSLGAIGYAAWISQHPGALPEKETSDFVRGFFGRDYLAPAIGAMLFPDLIQRLSPLYCQWFCLPDRAASLEEAFEISYGAAARGGPNLMAEDYLTIWAGLADGSAQQADAWVPLVFSNGTHVESGKRIVTAPVSFEDLMPDTLDFYSDMNLDRPIRASTAVLNSARFPIVSPAGTLAEGPSETNHIVDGGYFENGGLETALDLAYAIRSSCTSPLCKERKIVIVEINNDDSQPATDMARGATFREPVGKDRHEELYSIGSETTSILEGLYTPRTARGVLAAKRLSSVYRPETRPCGADKANTDNGLGLGCISYYTFQLGELIPNRATAMSWSLAKSSRALLDSVFDDPSERSQAADAKASPDGAIATTEDDRLAAYCGDVAKQNREVLETLSKEFRGGETSADEAKAISLQDRRSPCPLAKDLASGP